MSQFPEEYVSQYFFQYAGYPKYKRSSEVYEGCCPFCREGDSWGKKKRFYYIPKDDKVMCHNCGYSGNGGKFIHDISGLSWREIYKESEEYDIIPKDIKYDNEVSQRLNINIEPLPKNSINLSNPQQLNYYNDDKVVKLALDYIKSRKLDVCVNHSEYYLSLDDFIHKNRLVLPYKASNKEIEFYQTRRLLEDGSPNYLSKSNSDKILPNLHLIGHDIPYIFVFEGFIDSLFVKNSTCCSGIQENSNCLFTPLQNKQLREYPFYKIIWVLDSQWQDHAAKSKSQRLLNMDQNVFIWPEKLGRAFKDFNEMCVKLDKNEISTDFIIKNTPKSKFEGLMKLNLIKSG
jgi:hypothetical protein